MLPEEGLVQRDGRLEHQLLLDREVVPAPLALRHGISSAGQVRASRRWRRGSGQLRERLTNVARPPRRWTKSTTSPRAQHPKQYQCGSWRLRTSTKKLGLRHFDALFERQRLASSGHIQNS